MVEASVQQYAKQPHFRCPVCRAPVLFALRLRSTRSMMRMPTQRGRPPKQDDTPPYVRPSNVALRAFDSACTATAASHRGSHRDAVAQALGDLQTARSQDRSVDESALPSGSERRLRARLNPPTEREMRRRPEEVHARAAQGGAASSSRSTRKRKGGASSAPSQLQGVVESRSRRTRTGPQLQGGKTDKRGPRDFKT